MNYDMTSEQSILEYAQRLEGFTLNQIILKEDSLESTPETKKRGSYSDLPIDQGSPIREHRPEYGTSKNKGKFGNVLESVYFGLKNNSESRPDFEEAGIELKATPLKQLKNKKYVAKERIVLGKINYDELVNEDFKNSHFLYKNSELLLVFYIHDRARTVLELEIKLVDLWKILEEDADIIKEDWDHILKMVKDGNAHKISEGDTFYLGACTKGSDADSSWVSQPFSDEPAKKRAFALKQSYVNQIFQILNTRKKIRAKHISLTKDKPKHLSLEKYIYNQFSPYLRLNESELKKNLVLKYTKGTKSRFSLIAKKILGARENEKILEFEKAGINLKTIRVEANGNIKEAMSFKQIRYTEIINKDWEDSSFYDELTRKFFFVIFKKYDGEDEYRLETVKLWNVPEQDLDTIKLVWEDTKDKIHKGIYDDFIPSSNDLISHIRPKARNAADKMITPQGGMETKKCFWLNRKYIKEQINRILKG